MDAIAIVVPVLGRPERANPLAQSIRDSTRVPYDILFICSPGDEAVNAYRAEADVWIVDWEPGPGDFAKKTNLSLRLTTQPFIFCGATDLTFTPGWDEIALRAANDTGAGVIGIDDGANPMVKAGKHSTHPLVRRSYAEDPGGAHGIPNSIYWDGYDHQCVDNELIELAQSRGEWVFARGSLVLHHHPFFDRTVRMDATYKKALAHGKEDRILFMRRRRLWQVEARARQRATR